MSFSLTNPNLLDAKFAVRIRHKQWESYARSNNMIADYIPITLHHKYKYLIDIDGNCASNPRNQLLMFCNSLILKVNSNSKSWFYPSIKPYEHFIPVKEDLSDLFSQIEWAQNHQIECKKIANNASKLANELFNSDTIDTYIYRLLEAYAIKQQMFY